MTKAGHVHSRSDGVWAVATVVLVFALVVVRPLTVSAQSPPEGAAAAVRLVAWPGGRAESFDSRMPSTLMAVEPWNSSQQRQR